MDDIRKAFATANKVDAGLFSFNSKGACENCNGAGVIYTELSFLGGVKTPVRDLRRPAVQGRGPRRTSSTGGT